MIVKGLGRGLGRNLEKKVLNNLKEIQVNILNLDLDLVLRDLMIEKNLLLL